MLIALLPVVIVVALTAVWRFINDVVGILIQPIINHFNAIDGDIPLPPADAADGVIRGRWDQDQGFQYARSSGVTAETFGNMVALVGEPPPLDEMRRLLKRGLLDMATFEQMYLYSRARNEWFDWYYQASFESMSAADAIECQLKGILDQSDASQLFEAAGGLPSQYQYLLDAAGNPIGVEAALNLLNHNLITADDAVAVIRHSRVNPQFENMALLLRHRWLAPFQVSQAIKAGAVDAATATQWLLEDGYPADQVAGIVAEGAGVKVAKHKDLTESQITELYDAGLFNHDEATAHLVNLGYDPSETDFILAVYDQRRELAMAQAAINQVRKVFLAGRIDSNAAQGMLNSLGVDPTAQQTYITIWTVEAASELKELTAAQIGTAAKDGVISNDEAVARWETMGYSSDDAGILLAIHGGPPPPGSPAALAAQTPPATEG